MPEKVKLLCVFREVFCYHQELQRPTNLEVFNLVFLNLCSISLNSIN